MLLVLLLLVTLACDGRSVAAGEPRADAARRSAALVALPAATDARATAAGPGGSLPAGVWPAREGLVDEHGLDVMAIVRRAGVAALDGPGGKPLAALSLYVPPYFVLAESQGGYVLGRTASAEGRLGWVSAADVVTWTSRVGVEPIARVSLYASPEKLIEVLREGGDARPFATMTPSGARRPFLWPVAESRTVEIDGAPVELMRVHVLVRDGEGEEHAPPAALDVADAQRAIRVLDVVFLVDATGSMTPFWQAAREGVEGLAARLARHAGKSGVDVRFRLVAFRDHGSASEQVLTRFALAGEDALRRDLASIAVSGGGDEPEAGLDALDEGLNSAWRGDALSTRIVFLVSDAPFHEGKGCANPEDLQCAKIVERARALGVRIFGLPVGQSSSGEVRALQLRQCESLTAATGGATTLLADASQAAARIESILAEASQRIGRTGRVLDEVGAGRREAREIASHTGFALEEVTEILQFLEGGGVKLAGDGPQMCSGWLVESWRGVPQVRRKTLVGRAEVELALAALLALRSDLSPRSAVRTAGMALSVRQRPAAALDWLLADEDQDIALALAARGIPARRDSLLRVSPSELAVASERRRLEIREAVSRAIDGLWELQTDTRAWVLRDGEGEAWAFLDEAVLP